MKRRRKTERKRNRLDLAIRDRTRVRLSQPIDERAPVPDDSRLLAELAWIVALKDGYIPRDRPSPAFAGPDSVAS